MIQQLKEGRAVDLAALLELKQLVHHSAESFFSTWVEGGNPCNFAKVTDFLSLLPQTLYACLLCGITTQDMAELELTMSGNCSNMCSAKMRLGWHLLTCL